MVKMRWLKKWNTRKPGDISNVAIKSAENFVSQGYAEYVDEPKKIERKSEPKETPLQFKQRLAEKRLLTSMGISKKEIVNDFIHIPTQLKNCQFNRVKFKQKKAFESGWQKKPYTYAEIQKFLPHENYGVICNAGLRVLDDDTKDKRLIDMFTELFGKTFRVRDHLYFRFDNEHSKKIILMNESEHLGEIQGENTYVVGPNSIHPSGERYEIKNDAEILTISYDKFYEHFQTFMQKATSESVREINVDGDEDLIQSLVPQWVEGKRQELAMSISGYMRKQLRYGYTHALDVIQRICELAKDPDYQERVNAVRSTYAKDESQVKGYMGLAEQNIIVKNYKEEEEKAGIVWCDTIPNWDVAKKKSYIEWNNTHELKLYAHKNDIIKGKPSIYDNEKRTIINIITTGEKTDKKTEEVINTFKFLDENYDKRFDGVIKDSLSKAFWVYNVVDDDGNEYIVLMDEKNHSSEVQYFYGMNVEVDNSNEIATEFKAKGKKNVFFCHSIKPMVQPLPKEEIIPYTQNFMKEHEFVPKVFRDFFFDLIFTHEDGNIYRQPQDYMLMRHAQLLSGKVNGYPLSTLSLGVAGCSKTMEVESIDHVFSEGVLEAGNSTPKSLVPSFKEKPASPGFIMSKNRIALVDELMKMVDNQIMSNGSIGEVRNQLSQLNYILEHKRRSVGSGNNNSFVGHCTAKTIMVGNPAGRMSFLSEHLKVLDESTLSRLFIWIKGFEHKRFVQSNEILKSPNTYSTYTYHVCEKNGCCIIKVFGDFIYYYYMTIYDSCQQFTVEVDYTQIERLYEETLALIPYELKNVWAARGRHHTELIIDGVTKWNRIFVEQKDDFVAREKDYEIAERILVQMANSWSEGLREQM